MQALWGKCEWYKRSSRNHTLLSVQRRNKSGRSIHTWNIASHIYVSSHWKWTVTVLNWAHLIRSQSAASNLLKLLSWSCEHWCVASLSFGIPFSAAVLRAENWALIRVLRLAQLLWLCDESTIYSSSHQWSSCYDVPIINHRTATHVALLLEHRVHLMCSATPH